MQLTRKSTIKDFTKIPAIVGDMSLSIVLPKSFAIDLGRGKGDFVNIPIKRKSL